MLQQDQEQQQSMEEARQQVAEAKRLQHEKAFFHTRMNPVCLKATLPVTFSLALAGGRAKSKRRAAT